jgi:phosphohistidine phosphatase SixA
MPSHQPSHSPSESIEKNGHDVTINMRFMRHAHYDKSDGSLSDAGLISAAEVGAMFTSADNDNYLAKGISSGYKRTRQTVNTITNSLDTLKRGRNKIALELGDPMDDIEIGDLGKFLANGEVEIGDKTISTKDLAAGLAKQIDHYTKVSQKLNSGSEVDLFIVTHLPWLLSFMRELAQVDKNLSIVWDQMAHEFKYLKGFDVCVKRRDTANYELELTINNEQFIISKEVLDKLIP